MSIDLEAIRARAEAATPGPWTAMWLDDCFIEPRICKIPANGCYDYNKFGANSQFIAHAREDVPALLAEVRRLNEKVRFQNKLLHAPVVDIFPNLTPKEKAEDAEIVRLENELHSVTAERDALKEDFTDFACSGRTNASPYCANKSPECTDAHEWCIDDKCKGFRPNACGTGKEQNDGKTDKNY
ncbi:MAG: hypothetical protein ACRC1I_25515 [Pseudomonas proteolytica]|uniref:hypothetical protein n=1 Tax=Pseudomonas proteolytica TaxID=219574 RepID=UPI003F3BA14E